MGIRAVMDRGLTPLRAMRWAFPTIGTSGQAVQNEMFGIFNLAYGPPDAYALICKKRKEGQKKPLEEFVPILRLLYPIGKVKKCVDMRKGEG